VQHVTAALLKPRGGAVDDPGITIDKTVPRARLAETGWEISPWKRLCADSTHASDGRRQAAGDLIPAGPSRFITP